MLRSIQFLNLCLVATLGLVSMQSYAETDAELMASGQWRDPATGLIWMRCAIGQRWTGSSCEGDPIQMQWPDSVRYFDLFNEEGFAGHADWRLPTIQELVTIRRCSNGWMRKVETESRITAIGQTQIQVDKGIYKTTLPEGQNIPDRCADDSNIPTIDIRIFPNTLKGLYWSRSPSARLEFGAWAVKFETGSLLIDAKESYSSIRAVRSHR